MQKENNNKIKKLIDLLEQSTNAKIKLVEARKLKKLVLLDDVFDFVNALLRKYNLRIKSRVIKKGNSILVEQVEPFPKESLNNIILLIEERGFKRLKNKKLNDKSFVSLIDENTGFMILLPKV